MDSAADQPDSTELDDLIISQTDDWALLRSPGPATLNQEKTSRSMYLVWQAEQPIPELMLQACIKLGSDKPDIPGLQLKFHTEPSTGFVINFEADWTPTSSAQAQSVLTQLVWEIERLTRT